MELVELLGVKGVITLLVLGWILVKSKAARKFLKRKIRAVLRRTKMLRFAAAYSIPVRLAHRLQPKQWAEMCDNRGLTGLKRGRLKKTPAGVDIRAGLHGSLTLDTLLSRIVALETGLGVERNTIKIASTDRSDKVVVRLRVRDPLKDGVPYTLPTGRVSITDPCPLGMDVYGDWTTVNLEQRILIAGTSGSGKSCTQRVMSSRVIQADDADLEFWDLKNGTEAQNYRGKAVAIATTTEECVARINWFRNVEIPRRAALMIAEGTTKWNPTAKNRVRIIQVDEGADLIRHLSAEDLDNLFSLVEQARALGVYIWWATQYPLATNLPTALRSQLGCIISMQLRRKNEAQLVFGDMVSEGWRPDKLRSSGWFLVSDNQHPKPDEYKAPLIPDEVLKAIPMVGTAVSTPPPPELPAKTLELPARKVSLFKVEVAAQELNTRKALLLALRGQGGQKATQLVTATGRQKTQVYLALLQLQAEGLVHKTGHGRYERT